MTGSGSGSIDVKLQQLSDQFDSEHFGRTNFEYYLYQQFELVELTLVYVPPDLQKQGIGSAFMRDFLDIVDQFSWGAMLMASDEHGVPIKNLIEFYSRYGFKVDGQLEFNSRGESLQKMTRAKSSR